MRQPCIVCERPAPGGFDRCECGFDFATGDTTRSLVFLRREHRSARAAQLGGAGLLASVPVLLAFVWGISPFAAILSLLAALVELVVGTVLFVTGTSDSRLARARLRALPTLPLPAARVVRSP
jgi:hypothetical protein